jgi:hypothetical protein
MFGDGAAPLALEDGAAWAAPLAGAACIPFGGVGSSVGWLAAETYPEVPQFGFGHTRGCPLG